MTVWFDSRTISSPRLRGGRTAQEKGIVNWRLCMPNKWNQEQIRKRCWVPMRIMMDNHEKKCVYCGSRKHLTVDHYIPRSRGGTSDPSNLVLACSDCNENKGDSLPLNFVWRRVNGNNQHRRQDARDLSGANTIRETNQDSFNS